MGIAAIGGRRPANIDGHVEYRAFYDPNEFALRSWPPPEVQPPKRSDRFGRGFIVLNKIDSTQKVTKSSNTVYFRKISP